MKKVIALLIMTIFGAVVPVQAQPPSIQGTWHITAVLTTTSVPNAYVREGHMKEEVWQIQQSGHTARLTTPNGSITGRYLSQTPEFPGGVWRFELMVPNFMNQPNLAAKFEVVIVKRSPNVVSGGSTVTYYGNNMFGGPWVPRGLESWRFEGTRVR